MPKKLLIFVALISFSLLITACSYKEAEKENVVPINSATTTNIIPKTVITPSVMDLKIGDKLGNFTVSKIEPLNANEVFSAKNYFITFDGSATVTGNYITSDLTGERILTPENTEGLPSLVEKEKYSLDFENDKVNDEFFKNGREGRVSVTFSGLILQSPYVEDFFDGPVSITNLQILK